MVNTVLGPIPADQLGKTLMHEHFLFGYPGYAGDITLGGFDRDAALSNGIKVAKKLLDLGVKTVVDPTPNEAGRDPLFLREISEKTGLNIICTTGYYYEGEGAPAYFKNRMAFADVETEIYEMFMKEITEGIGKTGIKAGAIKLASSKNAITDYERMFFKAAARAQKETGVTIITHTQSGTMGPEQAELLLSEGADPNRIMIGHMCCNTDMAYHLRTLEKGVSIGFDRFGLQGRRRYPMDTARCAILLGLIGMGYINKIMLSHDYIVHWLGRPYVIPEAARELLANWYPTHIFENIVPLLMKAGITEEQIHTIFIDNPKRIFGG